MDNKEILTILGKRLKELRLKANLTQAELAEKLELSPNFIGMVERGERNTTFVNVYKIAKILDKNLETFFKGL